MLRHSLYMFILSALSVIDAFGQVSSPLNRFEVDFIRGCAPLTVTVTNTSGEINDQYFYDADTCDSASPKFDAAICAAMTPVSNTTFTYTQPGTYSLVQVLTNLVPRTDTVVIEVFAPQTPQVEVFLCNNYQVMVQVNDTFYDQFSVDYGDGSPPSGSLTHTYAPVVANYPITISGYFTNGPVNCADTIINISPVNTIPTASISQLTVTASDVTNGEITLDYIINNQVQYILEYAVNGLGSFTDFGMISGNRQIVPSLNTLDNVYCFRLAALDPCNNLRTYSDTICSVNLQVMAQNSQNVLNWNTEIVNFNSFELNKNGAALGAPITNSNTTTFADSAVACNVNYCYQIVTRYNNGSRSISAENCVTGINNTPPPAIQSLTASVEGPSIVLDWQLPDPLNFPMSNYILNRSINNNPFKVISQGSVTPYVDVNLRPQINTHCYGVIYEDGCGNQSAASVTACAIRLQGVNDNNRNFLLNWSPYLGWQNGVREYQLEILDENGLLIGSPIIIGNNINNYTDIINASRQITQYRIVALSNDAVPFRSASNIIISDIPLQVFVPNSFTPNNDGLNDIFLAKGLFIEEFSMEIYSRWGELLFRSQDLDQGWDGIYKGTRVPDGAYIYQITAIDPQGRALSKSGAVNVLSKPN